jgi:hypothetical protein
MRTPRRAAGTAALATLLTVATALPAQAHTSVCAGTGELITANPLTDPGVGPAVATAFTMYFPTAGTCVGGAAPETFFGNLAGNCGAATGSGTSTTGHPFTLAWTGLTMALAGTVSGYLVVTEASGSCLSGANDFTIRGELVLAGA